MATAIGPWILGVALVCVAGCGDDGAAVTTADGLDTGFAGSSGSTGGPPPTVKNKVPAPISDAKPR